ncbi:MAG: ABC transporter permease [Verrucomicrobiota bacterium]
MSVTQIEQALIVEDAVSDSESPIMRIRAVRPWMWSDVKELWDYRDLLSTLAMRDLKLRYRQTALGVLWVLFQPLAGAGIFSIVFGRVAGLSGEGYSYFIFSLSGLLVWNAFQSTLSKASTVLISNGALVSKVYFPRLLLPLSTLLSTLVDFLVGLCAFVVIALSSGWMPTWTVLQLPLWLGLSLGMAVGSGLIAASLMTRFRDVQHVLPMLLPFLMYATPVAYGMTAVPADYKNLFDFNPMAWVVEGARNAFLGRAFVPLGWFVYAIAFTLLVLVLGVVCFRRMERNLADVL